MTIEQQINDMALFPDAPAGELDPLRAAELRARCESALAEYASAFAAVVFATYMRDKLTRDEARFMLQVWQDWLGMAVLPEVDE